MTWHVAPTTLDSWISGDVTSVSAASVEQHLLACADCRAVVADRVASAPPLDLDGVWSQVADRVEPPRPNAISRAMRRLGVREPDALVVGVAPAFTAAWIAAVTVVVTLTVVASGLSPDRALGFYLLLAPLVPMAGVAAAYGDGVDPSYELAVTTPYSQLRVLLLRTAAVLVCAVPLTVLAGAALDPWWVAVAWLAPGLAFVLLVLAATTWFPPIWAASAVATGWTALSVLATLRDHQLLLVSRPSVAVSTVVAVGAAVLLVSRRHALSTVPRMGVLR